MREVELLSNAWHGDDALLLSLPDEWQITVVEPAHREAIGTSEIRERITHPIGSVRLSSLVAGKNRASILVDDLSRPTPLGAILPDVIGELAAGGLGPERVTVIVAGGTHSARSADEVAVKTGSVLSNQTRVVCHSCRQDLVKLGRSQAGTPLSVNRHFMEADLKIGLGGVFPHRAAGFSGGVKIVAPGVCGMKTIEHLHRKFAGGESGLGLLDTPFRKECESIAGQTGLDFIVNVVLNRNRHVEAVFAGDRIVAHKEAAEYAKQKYSVGPAEDADIVIADAYPFDNTLQFALSRGSWPLLNRKDTTSLVLLAGCSEGLGHHELFPQGTSVLGRIGRKMRRIRPHHLQRLLRPTQKRGKGAVDIRRGLRMLVLSPALAAGDLSKAMPKAQLFRTWDGLVSELRNRHGGNPAKVTMHRCAPLQLPG